MKRFYVLEGKEVDSDEVSGFLHKARTVRGKCLICDKSVKVGDEYVRFNYFDSPDPYHLKCFIDDHVGEDVILGIKIEKRKMWYGTTRTYVVCKKFRAKEN